MTKFKDYLQIVILVTIIISSILIQFKLSEIRDIIKESKTPKLEISNSSQFTKLCEQLTSQWNAQGYAFYLIQPKSSLKTHKEKAGSSFNYDHLPVRLELSSTITKERLIRKNYVIGNRSESVDIFHTEDISAKQFLILPVYQNTVIVGELYIFYNESKVFDHTSIRTKTAEAQMLSKLFT